MEVANQATPSLSSNGLWKVQIRTITESQRVEKKSNSYSCEGNEVPSKNWFRRFQSKTRQVEKFLTEEAKSKSRLCSEVGKYSTPNLGEDFRRHCRSHLTCWESRNLPRTRRSQHIANSVKQQGDNVRLLKLYKLRHEKEEL